MDGEEQLEHQAEPEDGHGQAEEGEEGAGMVEEAVAVGGGHHADAQGQGQRDDEAAAHQQQGGGQPLADVGEHGAVVGVGGPPVAVQDAAQPAQELHVAGLVEAQVVAEVARWAASTCGLRASSASGPPGRYWISRKVGTITPSSSGIACTRRRAA